jgi:hypothetical protein
MKQSYTVPVRLSEELVRKLIYIAQAEGRTPNNQFTFMLRNNIQYFEKTKGRISPAALAAIDLSPYRDADGEEHPEDQPGKPVERAEKKGD